MYARIHNGVVLEICIPIEGFTIEQCFHPDLTDQMIPCSPEVKQGWLYDFDKCEFIPSDIV